MQGEESGGGPAPLDIDRAREYRVHAPLEPDGFQASRQSRAESAGGQGGLGGGGGARQRGGRIVWPRFAFKGRAGRARLPRRGRDRRARRAGSRETPPRRPT